MAVTAWRGFSHLLVQTYSGDGLHMTAVPCRHKARVLEDLTHAAICAAQRPGEFYEMRTDIILLLKQALAAQQGSFQAILSGESPLACEWPLCICKI